MADVANRYPENVAGKYYVPQVGAFVIYVAMVVLLIVFPHGLAGRRT